MDPNLIQLWVQWIHWIDLCPLGFLCCQYICADQNWYPKGSFIHEASSINRLSGGIQMGHNSYSIGKKVALCIGNLFSRQVFKELRGGHLFKDIWYLYGPYVNMFWRLISQWACFLHNFLVSIWVQILGLVGTVQNSGVGGGGILRVKTLVKYGRLEVTKIIYMHLDGKNGSPNGAHT